MDGEVFWLNFERQQGHIFCLQLLSSLSNERFVVWRFQGGAKALQEIFQ